MHTRMVRNFYFHFVINTTSRYRSASHSPPRRGRDDDRGGRGGYDDYRAGGRTTERSVDRNADRGMDRGADRSSIGGGDREYRDVRARSSERESYRAGGDSRGYK